LHEVLCVKKLNGAKLQGKFENFRVVEINISSVHYAETYTAKLHEYWLIFTSKHEKCIREIQGFLSSIITIYSCRL